MLEEVDGVLDRRSLLQCLERPPAPRDPGSSQVLPRVSSPSHQSPVSVRLGVSVCDASRLDLLLIILNPGLTAPHRGYSTSNTQHQPSGPIQHTVVSAAQQRSPVQTTTRTISPSCRGCPACLLTGRVSGYPPTPSFQTCDRRLSERSERKAAAPTDPHLSQGRVGNTTAGPSSSPNHPTFLNLLAVQRSSRPIFCAPGQGTS